MTVWTQSANGYIIEEDEVQRRTMKYLLFFALISCCHCLHLKGSFHSSQFFSLLAKFGFEKTDHHDHANTLGYIYGNITSTGNHTHKGTLVVVERDHFLDLWGNHTRIHEACASMFDKLQKDAFDSACNPNGTQDFLRNIPCGKGKLCEDEDAPDRVIKNSQFTYTTRDIYQPRFWYVTLVSCYRDPKTCAWKSSINEDITFDYNIHLRNGNPHESTAFDDEFSFEEQGCLQRTFIFFFLYLFLASLQCYVQINTHPHPLTRILFIALILQLLSHAATLLHNLSFAWNGAGHPAVKVFGEISYILAQSFFIVLIMLIARGYAITRSEITGKRLLLFLWLTYMVAHVILYTWVNTEIDPILEIDEFETYPGGLVLVVRMALMMFMLRELRITMHLENNQIKLRFYLHLAAGLVCWFIYLPILAVIAAQVSSLWKQNLIHGIMSCADFLAYAVVTHVLWPAECHDYLQLQSVYLDHDDVDDYMPRYAGKI